LLSSVNGGYVVEVILDFLYQFAIALIVTILLLLFEKTLKISDKLKHILHWVINSPLEYRILIDFNGLIKSKDMVKLLTSKFSKEPTFRILKTNPSSTTFEYQIFLIDLIQTADGYRVKLNQSSVPIRQFKDRLPNLLKKIENMFETIQGFKVTMVDVQLILPFRMESIKISEYKGFKLEKYDILYTNDDTTIKAVFNLNNHATQTLSLTSKSLVGALDLINKIMGI
jgi:hypothetical protein